ncbi:MAG TPA: hypothetical protein VFB22_05560 [Candidatus Baltobacteraceae bacterium]|nr:hypothetical protein [Candidatus Baltobacteraceae bacterium]
MNARIAFGASAVLVAVVGALFSQSDVWHDVAGFAAPARAIAVWCLTAVQLAGGVSILDSRAARGGAVAVGLVFAILAPACIPGILAAPAQYAGYGDFFENASVVCGAVAVYALTKRALRERLLRRIARVGFGVCAASFAAAQAVYLTYTASLVPAWIPPNGVFWTVLTTIAFGLAAVAIVSNVRARLALRLTSAMIAAFAVLVWLPRLVMHPQALGDWSEFAESCLIAAAAWAVGDAAA